MDDSRNVVREAANLKSKNGQEVSVMDFLTRTGRKYPSWTS